MKITLKLYALLSDYLPPGADKQIATIDIEEGATPRDIIEKYRIPEDLAHLVLVNGVYVSPDDRSQFRFSEGDTLAIWPPVAGG